MLNITSRIAVRIKHLPEWRSLDSLTLADFLPSEEDGEVLKKRAVTYVRQFLVNEFASLAHLKQFIPEEVQHNKDPDTVVPMKVLFKDEKYTAETIDILSQISICMKKKYLNTFTLQL